MDEYDHLTDSQWDLYDRMSGISEDCFCAGWDERRKLSAAPKE